MNDSRRTLASLRAAGDFLLRRPRPGLLAVVVAWMALIWTLSSRMLSGDPLHLIFVWLSNGVHAPLFGLLGLGVVAMLPRTGGWPRLDVRQVSLVLALVLTYALIDELHQSTVPGRDASIFDLFTDWSAAYITLGVAVVAGRAGTQEPAFRRRLGLGVLICCLAGLMATFF